VTGRSPTLSRLRASPSSRSCAPVAAPVDIDATLVLKHIAAASGADGSQPVRLRAADNCLLVGRDLQDHELIAACRAADGPSQARLSPSADHGIK
jgi:hypothetical protein